MSRAPVRYRSPGDLLVSIAATAVILAVITIIPAWSFMLFVGMVHAWWPFVPAMSFGTALPMTVIPTVIGLAIRLFFSYLDESA